MERKKEKERKKWDKYGVIVYVEKNQALTRNNLSGGFLIWGCHSKFTTETLLEKCLSKAG